MKSTVIVALPSEEDKVYKISSERVPHLTLVSLGDISNDEDAAVKVIEFVEHASRELSPFGLSVDHRGTLGDKDADVVFFEKDRWSADRIGSFRAHLLQNDAINRGFLTSPQFDEWTPHLTLGYPESPAHPDDSEYPGIHHITFDRIAVWLGDYEGPEFRLKYDDYPMEVVMSDVSADSTTFEEVIDGILKHYGKKGMRWGVRTAEKAQSQADRHQTMIDRKAGNATKSNLRRQDRLQARADKKFEKADTKWEKSVYSADGAVKVHNAMADHFNSRIAGVNDKHPDADYRKGEDTPEWKAYMADVNTLQSASYSHAVSTIHGKSPSGKKKAEYYNDGKGEERIVIHSAHLAHAEADDTEPDLILLVKTDEAGRVLELNQAELSSVEHSDDLDAFIAHYGVKGMKWGVTTVDKASQPTLTREKQAYRDSKDVTVTQRKAGTYVKTKGGQRQKATDDAVKAAAARQKAKKSTTDSLTNDELKAAVERMNLEQQYAKLDAKTKRRGSGFVAFLFSSPEARAVLNDKAKRVAASN